MVGFRWKTISPKVTIHDGMEFEYGELGLRYREVEGVYPVREDSLILLNTLLKSTSGMVGEAMEMGCGSALVSLALSRKGWKVSAVDREPRALMNLRYNLILNGLEADIYLSDLFEGIPRGNHGRFDLIIFNPPYVKGIEGEIDRRDDLALLGGRSGYDTALRFLAGGYHFLGKGGRIILLAPEEWPGSWDSPADLAYSTKRVLTRSEIDGEGFLAIEYSF